MTPDDGLDPFDGTEENPVRRFVLEKLSQSEEDMSDLEHLMRATDQFWFDGFCIEELNRLPSEVAPIIGMREVTKLRARAMVKDAYMQLAQRHAAKMRHSGGGAVDLG